MSEGPLYGTNLAAGFPPEEAAQKQDPGRGHTAVHHASQLCAGECAQSPSHIRVPFSCCWSRVSGVLCFGAQSRDPCAGGAPVGGALVARGGELLRHVVVLAEPPHLPAARLSPDGWLTQAEVVCGRWRSGQDYKEKR
jgi:hypothetical protein